MADQQTLAPYSEREITLTRLFDAPRARVWAAWTEPEHLVKWFAPAGFSCPEASVDLRVGGEARLVMRGPDGVDMPNVGHFEEVVDQQRLVMRSEVNGPDGAPLIRSRYVATFEDAGGRCRITVTAKAQVFSEQMLPALEGMQLGWDQCIDKLETVVDERTLLLVHHYNAPVARVWEAWTTPDQLKQWFGPRAVTITEARVDLRPGGEFFTQMQVPEQGQFDNPGAFLQVVPMQRLVFTDAYGADWVPSAKPFMTVTVDFVPWKDGCFVNSWARHWTVEDRQAHEAMGFHSGWGEAADRLAELVESNG